MIPRYETEAMTELWSATTLEDRQARVQAALAEASGDLAGASLLAPRGATLADAALALSCREALQRVLSEVDRLRAALAVVAEEHRATTCAVRIHGRHAGATSFGLVLAGWHAELGRDYERLELARERISYATLRDPSVTGRGLPPEVERAALASLGLRPEPVSAGSTPRDRHAEVVAALALLGACLERVAVALRHLQRSDLAEALEAFGRGQTGSSAMPHKRNPITGERLTGMARLLRGYLVAALEGVAVWHQGDDTGSPVEAVALPDAFHLVDYMLARTTRLIEGLEVHPEAMRENLRRGGGDDAPELDHERIDAALERLGIER